MKIDFGLMGTDPEFASLFEAFAMEEVPGQDDLDGKTRMMAILAALLGCQVLPAAMEEGVTPVEIKEIIYQAVAYLGIGRVLPFFETANKVLSASGVILPLPGQSTTGKEVLWSSFFVTLVAKKYRLATMLPFVPRMVCDSR